MIIACGVLSCVAVLLGIIILEIAIDKKEKRKAKKQAEEQTLQTSQTSSVEKQSDEPVQTNEPIKAEEHIPSDEKLAEEPEQVDEPIIAEEPVAEEPVAQEEPVNEPVVEEVDETVVAEEPVQSEEHIIIEPASEPVIEEAPAHVEEIAYVENIISEEPVVIVEHTTQEAPAVEEAPVIEDTPIIAIEQASPVENFVEEPVQVEEPIVAEEIVAEPVVAEEPAPVEEPIVAEELEVADEEDLEDPDDEVASELKVVVKDGQTRYIVIKYSKSFEAKLIQGTDEAKRYYSELKNCLLSYGVKSNGVKARMSWKWESFRYGRKTLARLRLRGKTISVVLALNPDDYKDTKYLVESVADIACYADTPALSRIKSDRRLKYTKELIDKMMQDNGLTQKPDFEPVDYAPQYPYDTTENLIERKLIKVLTDEDAQSGEVFKPSDIRKSVKAQDVDSILQDEIAAELIEKLDGVSDKTKSGIINIDTLSQNFRDGETVTIEEIRKRIKSYNKVTYIKVLARGTLDKRLTVEADDFSLQAVKMIALLGGKIIKK